MNEDSDGLNENENNNSEVVILPERSHVEELLLSDQSDTRDDPSDYERKLDEKLKDLGLWEDDMTINQKEELLAVVVISCETAEQEENKRQLIKEYLEGAQNLPDEIEFSLQESAWLADEANLLCSSTVTASKDDTLDRTKLSSFANYGPSTSAEDFDGFESISQAERTSFRSSPEIFEDATAYSELFLDSQSSTSENDTKTHDLEKGQSVESKRFNFSAPDNNVKIAVTHPILYGQDTKRSKAGHLFDKPLSDHVGNLFLENAMPHWKPCMSPKNKPLTNFRFNKQKYKKGSTSSTSKRKINKYLNSFYKIASHMKRKQSSSSKLICLNKPYVLLHHGSLARKTCKLDNYDFIIGVTDKVLNNEPEDNFIPTSNTLTRAKSAFHRVKPSSHGKLLSFSDSSASTKTTRSGATYGSQKVFKVEEEKVDSAEIVLEDLFDDTNDDFDVDGATVTAKHVTFQVDDICDNSNKLPKFGDLKPEIHKSSNMLVPSPVIKRENSPIITAIQPNCIQHNSSEKNSLKDQKLGNVSEKEYSSDSSSSLIDVETIVDDEIEEFVMKRKFTPTTHKSNHSKNLCHSKRLRKNDS